MQQGTLVRGKEEDEEEELRCSTFKRSHWIKHKKAGGQHGIVVDL